MIDLTVAPRDLYRGDWAVKCHILVGLNCSGVDFLLLSGLGSCNGGFRTLNALSLEGSLSVAKLFSSILVENEEFCL